MSSTQISNASAPSESKSAKKKKAKVEALAPSALPSTDAETGNGSNHADVGVNGADSSYESPYIKELYKYV